MIITLEEAKNTLLKNIQDTFTQEKSIHNKLEELLIVRDSLCKINFAFFSHAENALELEGEIKVLITLWFTYIYLDQQESFDEWLGGYFINDLEVRELFKEAIRPEKKVLDKVYWHEEALHLEDWKVLQERNRQDQTENNKSTKVISFYSYKGGVGRTTLCAITALELSQRGKKVVIIDTDIEAPGLAFQFFGQEGKASYRYSGFLDFLLYPYEQLSITQKENFDRVFPGEFLIQNRSDYPHVYLMPVTKFSDMNTDMGANDYEQKISRVNFLQGTGEKVKFLLQLLEKTVQPDYVIFDLRTGITDIGGILANRSDFYCFVGYPDSQNRLGLSFFIAHALRTSGEENVFSSNTLFVHSPAPVNEKKEPLLSEKDAFVKMVRDLLTDHNTWNEEVIEEEFLLQVPYQPNLGALIREEGIKEVYKGKRLDYIEYYKKIAGKIYLVLPQGVQVACKPTITIGMIGLGSDAHLCTPVETRIKIFKEYKETSQNFSLTSKAADAESDLDDSEKMVHNFQYLHDYKEILKDDIFLIIGEKGAGKSALEQVFDHSKNQTRVVNFLIRRFDIHWDMKNLPVWLAATDKSLIMILTTQIKADSSLERFVKKTIFWKAYSFSLIEAYLREGQVTHKTRERVLQKIIIERESILEKGWNEKDFHSRVVQHGKRIVLTYDYLDTLESGQNSVFLESIEELVKLWYILKLPPGLHALNAKIFLRDDLFEKFTFSDKGKIQSNHAYYINWDFYKLMAVLFKRLCARSESLFSYLKEELAKENILLQRDEETGMITFPEKQEAIEKVLPLLFGEKITQSSSSAFFERYLWNGKVTRSKKQYNVRFMLALMSRVLKECEPLPPEKGIFDVYTTMKEIYCQIATQWVNNEVFMMYPELKPLIERLKEKARGEPNKFKSGRIKATELKKYLKTVGKKDDSQLLEAMRQLESIGFIQKFKYDYDEFEQLEFYFPELFRAYLGIKKVNSLPPC